MPNALYMQNNFTHGELDPRLFAGTNLDYYYKSLKRARNVYVRPQGGVKKRHGSKYLKTIEANIGEYRLAPYLYTEDTEFLLVFLDGKLQIEYLDSNGDITSTQVIIDADFTATNIQELQYAQNGNAMIIVHPDFAPKELTYDASGGAFVDPIADFTIKNPPAYDFDKNYYTYTFTLSVATVGVGATLTSSAAVFQSNHVGGVFIATGGSLTEPIGFARIKTVTGPYPATTATVDIIYAFDNSLTTTGAVGDACFLGESAISSVRGYPKSVSFYENRLVFGATNELPQTLFISRIGAFNDFDQGDGSDDDAILATLSTESYNEIKFLVSDKTLQVFCNESAFSSMQTFDEPLTPGNTSFRKQGAYGCNDMPPVLLDNKTFYCRKGGKAIMEMVFDPSSTYYTPLNASLFSAILVNNPLKSTALIGDEVDDADYMFLVNQDGSLLVYQSVSSQNVSAYTICVTGSEQLDLEIINPTQGQYKDITTVGNKVYTIVTRVINNVVVQYLERFTFDYYTDCSTTYNLAHPSNVITGLGYLEGERPRVVGAGGKVLRVDNEVNDGKVTSGQLTLLDSDTEFNVGLNFNVLIETIPANLAGQGKLYIPKKIVRLFIDYYESLGIKVNGEYIPELTFGDNVLDRAPVPKTGIFTTRGTEWAERTTIQITQEDPVPFLVIGLGFEVTE